MTASQFSEGKPSRRSSLDTNNNVQHRAVSTDLSWIEIQRLSSPLPFHFDSLNHLSQLQSPLQLSSLLVEHGRGHRREQMVEKQHNYSDRAACFHFIPQLWNHHLLQRFRMKTLVHTSSILNHHR